MEKLNTDGIKRYKSILMVDDDKHDQEYFAEMLNEADSSALLSIAPDGKQALELLHSSTTLPDLIFLDLNMPIMDGFEFLTHLKSGDQYKGLKKIPVIVFTTTNTHYKKCYNLGACLSIPKPTTTGVYRSMLYTILNSDVEGQEKDLRLLFEKLV
jgi:CheY-like chemotaxis protein